MEEKFTNITSNTAGDNSTVTTGRNVSSPVFGSYGSEIGFFSIFITLRYHIDYFKGVYRGLLDGRVLN